MISHAKQKVKEGKVIKVEIEYADIITNVRITGDFFIHPEDALDRIEKSIAGMGKNTNEEAILLKIQESIALDDVQMIGISAESIAMLVKEALK